MIHFLLLKSKGYIMIWKIYLVHNWLFNSCRTKKKSFTKQIFGRRNLCLSFGIIHWLGGWSITMVEDEWKEISNPCYGHQKISLRSCIFYSIRAFVFNSRLFNFRQTNIFGSWKGWCHFIYTCIKIIHEYSVLTHLKLCKHRVVIFLA